MLLHPRANCVVCAACCACRAFMGLRRCRDQIFESVDDAAIEALSLSQLAIKLKSTDIDVSRSPLNLPIGAKHSSPSIEALS